MARSILCTIHHQRPNGVRKSVLAAELFALVDGFDIEFSTSHQTSQMVGRKVDLVLYNDWQSLYVLSISLAQTTERRLHIDLAIIREGYESRYITEIVWIEGTKNPADDFTKPD